MAESIKKALKGVLTKKELELMPNSFDTLGGLIIFNSMPKELVRKEKKIGQAILKHFSHIKTVCKKTGKYGGVFRTPKLKIMAGERKKETLYKENGCLILLHPEKTYFSARLSTERNRIASLVKPGEKVLVMFSGVGVYPCVISKNSKAARVIGVEINPVAHKYGLENIKLNKLKNVTLINSDVRKAKLDEKFDRIAMPLPKSAEDFLGIAFKFSKKGTVIHLYDFLHEDEFDKAVEKIEKACARAKIKCEILSITKCGQHSPRVFRICVDFRIV